MRLISVWALAVAAVSVGASAGVLRAWAWPIHHDNDANPLAVALALFALGALGALGALALILVGTREPRSEQD